MQLLQRARPLEVAAKIGKFSISKLSIAGRSRFAVKCELAFMERPQWQGGKLDRSCIPVVDAINLFLE